MDNRRFSQEMARLLDDDTILDAAIIARLDALLWVLYPEGVQPSRYAELIRAVCVLERLCIAMASEHESAQGESDEHEVTGRSSRGVVMETLQNDATEPMPSRVDVDVDADADADADADDKSASRPWTYLSAFSLRDVAPEKRQLMSRYAALVENMLASTEEPVAPNGDEPDELPNG